MPDIERKSSHFYMRCLNVITENNPIDIYANKKLITENLPYASFTEYFKGQEGNFDFQILKSGTPTDGLEEELVLDNHTVYTLAAIGGKQQELLIIPDIPAAFDAYYAHVRYIHLSPDCPSVSIFVDDANTINDLFYKEVSGYYPVTPGKHSLTIYPHQASKPVLTNPNVTLKAGKCYAVYLIGAYGGQPSMQVLIPLEGITYCAF